MLPHHMPGGARYTLENLLVQLQKWARESGSSWKSWGLMGVTVTSDIFFTSYPLAQEPLMKKVSLVGTIRANKSELPAKLKQ